MLLFSLSISKTKQKRLVSLGPALLRIPVTLQKARTSNSTFWQGSPPKPMHGAEKHFKEWK